MARDRNSTEGFRKRYGLGRRGLYLPRKVSRIDFVGKGVGLEITNPVCGVCSPDGGHLRTYVRMYDSTCVQASVQHAHVVSAARAPRPTFTPRLTASESTGGKRRRSAIMNSSRELFFAESSSSSSSWSSSSSPHDDSGGRDISGLRSFILFIRQNKVADNRA